MRTISVRSEEKNKVYIMDDDSTLASANLNRLLRRLENQANKDMAFLRRQFETLHQLQLKMNGTKTKECSKKRKLSSNNPNTNCTPELEIEFCEPKNKRR